MRRAPRRFKVGVGDPLLASSLTEVLVVPVSVVEDCTSSTSLVSDRALECRLLLRRLLSLVRSGTSCIGSVLVSVDRLTSDVPALEVRSKVEVESFDRRL